jgi:3-methyladenine DNA glycosylase AlkD
MTKEEAIALLYQNGDEKHRQIIPRYGITAEHIIGVRMPQLRKIAKQIGRNQTLASELWATSIHEAKHLAIMISDPRIIKNGTLQQWVSEVYSWDLCDNLCDLIAKTPDGMTMAQQWVDDEREYVKRCGIVTHIASVIHNKRLSDEELLPFLSIIEAHAWDGRNFVKKALNWLLRQMGKRSLFLHAHAIECAEKLSSHPDPSARWIAKDALRELKSEALVNRLKKKK